MEELKQLLDFFKKKEWTLSLAESCTGGKMSAMVCENPGISAVFHLGVVAYSNDIKNKMLKVKKRTLKKYGAVSYQTVREMAEGVLKLSESDFSVAISGIAGPSGGSIEKPVGTVWIGVADKNGGYSIRRFNFTGERVEIQEKAVKSAVELLKEYLERNYGEKIK